MEIIGAIILAAILIGGLTAEENKESDTQVRACLMCVDVQHTTEKPDGPQEQSNERTRK